MPGEMSIRFNCLEECVQEKAAPRHGAGQSESYLLAGGTNRKGVKSSLIEHDKTNRIFNNAFRKNQILPNLTDQGRSARKQIARRVD
jgi:hypothetical protein